MRHLQAADVVNVYRRPADGAEKREAAKRWEERWAFEEGKLDQAYLIVATTAIAKKVGCSRQGSKCIASCEVSSKVKNGKEKKKVKFSR